MVKRIVALAIVACWVHRPCGQESYFYVRKDFEPDSHRLADFVDWIQTKGLEGNKLAKAKTSSLELAISTRSKWNDRTYPTGVREIEIRVGKTFYNFDYDTKELTLLHRLQELPRQLPPEEAGRVLADPARRAEYCRVSQEDGYATAVEFMKRALGDVDYDEFRLQKQGLIRNGDAPLYRYYFLPDQNDDFFDDRTLEVTVNPVTGQIVAYQLLGNHLVGDYRPTISRQETLTRFWQRYRGYESRLKLNRMGLVKLQYFGRPQTWYWQICMDYKVRDLEAYQQAFPWAGDTARLTAWIDAETGDIFGAREPDW